MIIDTDKIRGFVDEWAERNEKGAAACIIESTRQWVNGVLVDAERWERYRLEKEAENGTT